MKRLFKLLKKPKSSAGFTLIELLVAMAITTIVVGLSGWGVVAITQKGQEQKAETDRRVELNRALDFIADEVRQAKPIATDASANLPTIASDFSSTNRTPILTLQIPGVSQRVIYYIAAKPSSSPWRGPNIISRWGPNFNADGTYSNPTAPANWTHEPLVDLIDNPGQPTPTCPNSGTLNTSSSIKGFYACVDRMGKVAEIHLGGKIVGAYGASTIFQVNTTVFARPYNPPFTLNTGSASSGGNGGTLTINQPSTMYIEVLGGAITCGAAGVVIPTTTTVNVTPSGGTTTNTTLSSSTKSLNLSAAIGTTLTVTGTALGTLTTPSSNICSGFTGSTYQSQANNGTQVLTLRNGDTVPLFSPFGTQPTIDSYLTKYIDPATGKVKIAENQVIYLYELGTTNSAQTSYDVQDLVVLATISPTNN